MRFRLDGDKYELFIESKERSAMKAFDKELESKDPKVVDEIIDRNLRGDLLKSYYHMYSNIVPSLKGFLTPIAADTLLSLISKPDVIYKLSEKLREEKLIGDKTLKLLRELSAKYGANLELIRNIVLIPNDWQRVESYPLKKNESIKLHTELFRHDGVLLEFDVPLTHSVVFAEHFIKSSLDVIRSIDKEAVLDIDKGQIEALENRIIELKELRISVESSIKAESKSEANTPPELEANIPPEPEASTELESKVQLDKK